jgi:hypothetical protein
LLKLINEKWAAAPKWKKSEAEKTVNAASTASYATTSSWKLTDEKGQVWNGIVSIQPVEREKNRFLLTLKVTRNDAASSSAQLK